MTQTTPIPQRRLTGWHMFAFFVAFFGVVIAVNSVLARLAFTTFSGEVVANSYVASQHFNGWLDQAEADRALGWQADVVANGPMLTVTLRDRSGQAMPGARITGYAAHPLGDATARVLRFGEIRPGSYAAPLAAGRWQVHLVVEAGGRRWQHVADVTAGATP